MSTFVVVHGPPAVARAFVYRAPQETVAILLELARAA